ncbi:metallophosphoesterase [Bacillus sp. BRMEA1]|uniref:metallophosphoesterase n=1 Tax=Neobacillus endophyticus TaxID=2738405 RepID=UPI001566D835|nr:metallophosphoesterase [Neobacillus endophyticus]NRD79433.1 metallophosphoesterase [Neobacillus endophyticus]
MKSRSIVNFLTIIVLYSALTFYIGWNTWIWFHTLWGFQDQWIFGAIVGVIAYSYIIGHFLKHWSIFKLIGSFWFGVMQYAILLLPVANFLGLLCIFMGLPSAFVIDWSGGIVFTALILLFIYGIYNAYSPVVRKYSIQIPKHAAKLPSLRIAMASDMHFGRLSGISHVKRLVREINIIKPDLILFPGDIVDDDPKPFIQKNMGEIMKQLKAPLGIYGVLGNHEYYGGDIPGFLKEMARIDINIMLDQIIKIENSFYLVGRKDKTDIQRMPIQELLKEADVNLPIIMMDHQPAELTLAERSGVDLLLSGHTHRGQMAPNHLITKRMFELDWGYLKKNQLHAIVSSGFGFWGPPLRIGSRSEVIQIDITFREKS